LCSTIAAASGAQDQVARIERSAEELDAAARDALADVDDRHRDHRHRCVARHQRRLAEAPQRHVLETQLTALVDDDARLASLDGEAPQLDPAGAAQLEGRADRAGRLHEARLACAAPEQKHRAHDDEPLLKDAFVDVHERARRRRGQRRRDGRERPAGRAVGREHRLLRELLGVGSGGGEREPALRLAHEERRLRRFRLVRAPRARELAGAGRETHDGKHGEQTARHELLPRSSYALVDKAPVGARAIPSGPKSADPLGLADR
jgi:hypothetical protein